MKMDRLEFKIKTGYSYLKDPKNPGKTSKMRVV